MEIRKVGVIGCGLMGSGIAQVCAQSGYETKVAEVSGELLEEGQVRIETFMEKSIKKGKYTEAQRSLVRKNLSGTVKIEDLKDSNIIIEAVTENLELKNSLWRRLDPIAPPHTIFATNTSSLKVKDQAAATERADRFVGLHFFNPVPVMKLVEVVRSERTSDETFETALSFVESLGKVGVSCIDTTGFVVNRLLVPYLLDAIRALEAGIAPARDIDNAMMLGCGHPMGPLSLLDFVGLDTTLYIADIMFREFKDPRYRPPELLKRMVADGKIGKKGGEGFYDYRK